MKRILFLLGLMTFAGGEILLAQSQGGGVYMNNSRLENTLVTGNESESVGTGVYAEGGSSIVNSTIANNKSGVGGVNLETIKIGDFTGGGIVFYMDEDIRVAYVVSIAEFEGLEWGKQGVSNSRAVDLYDGEANTKAIIDSQVVIPRIDYQFVQTSNGTSATVSADTMIYAAQWSVRQRDGKYSDWYLPSREQLKLLYIVKSEVNEGLGKVSSAKLLQNKLYWSSSEKDANSAWYVHFKVGEVNGGYKSSSGCVRAVRAFRY